MRLRHIYSKSRKIQSSSTRRDILDVYLLYCCDDVGQLVGAGCSGGRCQCQHGRQCTSRWHQNDWIGTVIMYVATQCHQTVLLRAGEASRGCPTLRSPVASCSPICLPHAEKVWGGEGLCMGTSRWGSWRMTRHAPIWTCNSFIEALLTYLNVAMLNRLTRRSVLFHTSIRYLHPIKCQRHLYTTRA